MKTKILFFLMLFLAISCATNPFTGKKTMALVPNSQILPMAFAQYDKFLNENKIDELFNITQHLAHVDHIFDKVFT